MFRQWVVHPRRAFEWSVSGAINLRVLALEVLRGDQTHVEGERLRVTN